MLVCDFPHTGQNQFVFPETSYRKRAKGMLCGRMNSRGTSLDPFDHLRHREQCGSGRQARLSTKSSS